MANISKRTKLAKSTRSYGLNDPNNLVIEEWPIVKRSLYEAARTLFWENGFAETSVQEIVDKAKLTKGAFYHYFKAKDDLLRVMYDRSLARLLPRLQAISEQQLSCAEVLTLFLEEMVEVIIAYRFEVALFWEQQRRLPASMFSDNAARRQDLQDALVSILHRGLANREFRNIPNPSITAMGLIGMCQFTQYWFKEGGAMSARAIGRYFADSLIRGIAADAGGR